MNRSMVAALASLLLVAGPLSEGAMTPQAFAGGKEDAKEQKENTAPPQTPRDAWKDCAYNNKPIRCQDQQQAEALRILWIDGIRSSFVRRPPSAPGLPSYWVDRYGGLWRRELLPQGNTLLTNLGTGNRIFIPLRLTCKPPLQGEVGYCRY